MAGNQNSGRKDKFTREALLMEMRTRESSKDAKGMRKLAETVWNLAETGERWAAEFIRDSLDGKPAQQVNLADETGEGPAKIVLITGVPRKGDADRN